MADPVRAEIAPLFGTEAAPSTNQALGLPVQAPGAQEGGEKHEEESTRAVQPVTAVATVPAKQTAVTTTAAKALAEDCYDLAKCTVVLTLRFYPVGEEGQARRVLLGIQNGASNKEDLPLLVVLNADELGGPLPPALQALWSKLEAELPLRKQRHDERVTKAAAVKAATPQTNVKRQGGAIAQPAKPATPPPPPTTTTPIQKEGLTMGGLFDGM